MQAHQGVINLTHGFIEACTVISNKEKIPLVTESGSRFEVISEKVKKGDKKGEPVIKFFQKSIEYGRAYECCWGHTTNCYRTIIGMYCKAVDRYLGNILINQPAIAEEVETKNLQRSFPMPNCADQYDFLLRLYFGDNGDALTRCINRAYLDFNRTLHGISSNEKKAKLRLEATQFLVDSFAYLLKANIDNQVKFDAWHEDHCRQLCQLYENGGYPGFTAGQAQKWVNMTMKYVHVFDNDLNDYAKYYLFAHIPIDNIILKKLAPYEVPNLSRAWSRIDYPEYMRFQQWVRREFPDSTPLAVEFFLWQAPEFSPETMRH